MEEVGNEPFEIRRVGMNKVQDTGIVYLKKRKFQDEQLDLPLRKQKCWDQCFTSDCHSSSTVNPEAKDFCAYLIKGKNEGGARDDESESAEDSNSFPGDADSVMSIPGEAKTDLEYPKICLHDRPSTSSVNSSENCFKTNLYSLDSRSATKPSAGRYKSPYICEDHSSPCHDFGLLTSLNYEEHRLEFGNHVDYCGSEYGNDDIDQYTEKELEDMLFSSRVNPNNYVLSSGRWDVNKETQSGTQKLTIDKEFEQYFSSLMLQ